VKKANGIIGRDSSGVEPGSMAVRSASKSIRFGFRRTAFILAKASSMETDQVWE